MKKSIIIIFSIVILISNIYIRLLENRYTNFIKNVSESVNLKAVIVSNRKENNYTFRYKIKVLELDNKKLTGIKLFLYIKKNEGEFNYGDVIEISGKYQKLATARNYKGFDYSEYEKKDGIYGNVIAEKTSKLYSKKSLVQFFNNINCEISNKISILFDEKEGQLLNGFLLGNKEEIDENIITYFRDSSLSHMLAVSGTHVSYIIIVVNILLNKIIEKRNLKIVTIGILIMFILIVGGEPSVIRASCMGTIMISSGLFHRKADTLNSMNISIILILMYNPYYIRDVGFLLSYGGVLGIILFYKMLKEKSEGFFERSKLQKYVKEVLTISSSVQIILIPINLILFNNIPILFFISNIVILPLISFTIIISIFIIFFSFINLKLVIPFAKVTNMILKIIILLAKYISEIPFSNVLISTPSLIYIIIYYLILALIYAEYVYKKSKKRIINVNFKKIKKIIVGFLIFIIIVSNIVQRINGNLRIHFIDVGQRRCYINNNS